MGRSLRPEKAQDDAPFSTILYQFRAHYLSLPQFFSPELGRAKPRAQSWRTDLFSETPQKLTSSIHNTHWHRVMTVSRDIGFHELIIFLSYIFSHQNWWSRGKISLWKQASDRASSLCSPRSYSTNHSHRVMVVSRGIVFHVNSHAAQTEGPLTSCVDLSDSVLSSSYRRGTVEVSQSWTRVSILVCTEGPCHNRRF